MKIIQLNQHTGRHDSKETVDNTTGQLPRLVESVDTADLKSAGYYSRASSSLATRTTQLPLWKRAQDIKEIDRLLGKEVRTTASIYSILAWDLNEETDSIHLPKDPEAART